MPHNKQHASSGSMSGGGGAAGRGGDAAKEVATSFVKGCVADAIEGYLDAEGDHGSDTASDGGFCIFSGSAPATPQAPAPRQRPLARSGPAAAMLPSPRPVAVTLLHAAYGCTSRRPRRVEPLLDPLPPPWLPTPSYPIWTPPKAPLASAVRPPPRRDPRPPPGPSWKGRSGPSNDSRDLGDSRELREVRSHQQKASVDVYRRRPYVLPRELPPPVTARSRRRSSEGEAAEGVAPTVQQREIEAWRKQMAESALRFARECDLPQSFLLRCGTLSLG